MPEKWGQQFEFGPPMGGQGTGAPAPWCTRIGCDQKAAWHIIWTADVENGLACDEHLTEARERWLFYAVHAYDEPICSNPKAIYHLQLNVCYLEDDPPKSERSIEELIEASSLGTPGAKQLRERTDPEVVRRILRRAEEINGKVGSDHA